MCERPGSGIASSGSAGSSSTAQVARTATRNATTDRLARRARRLRGRSWSRRRPAAARDARWSRRHPVGHRGRRPDRPQPFAGSGCRPGVCPAGPGSRRPRSRDRGRARRTPARRVAGSPRISGGTATRAGGSMSSRPLPSTVTGRYGYTVYCAGAAWLRRTKSRTPRIWLPGASSSDAVHRHRHATGDVVVAAAVQVGQDARPHQQHHAAVAVIVAHHRAAHLDQRGPQRVQRADVEFGCGVEPSGGDGARRRQHPVAADELAGVVLADQQVIAVLVEAVGVAAVDVAPVEREARLGGEHVVTKSLRGLDRVRGRWTAAGCSAAR